MTSFQKTVSFQQNISVINVITNSTTNRSHFKQLYPWVHYLVNFFLATIFFQLCVSFFKTATLNKQLSEVFVILKMIMQGPGIYGLSSCRRRHSLLNRDFGNS